MATELENTLKKARFFINNNMVKITLEHTDKIYFDVGHVKDVILYEDGRFSCGGDCMKGTIFNGTRLCSHVISAILYIASDKYEDKC